MGSSAPPKLRGIPTQQLQSRGWSQNYQKIYHWQCRKDGSINIDAFQEAIVQYRNTPYPTTKMSPAMCVLGRLVKDLIPILPGKHHPHPTWRESLQLREQALRQRYMRHQYKWSEHTKTLSPLQVGDRVWIQNQTGPHPKKWDPTGIVIEVHQFHPYLIRIDGSGRQTLRNRKFLRKFIPVYQPPTRRSITEDIAHLSPTDTTSPFQRPLMWRSTVHRYHHTLPTHRPPSQPQAQPNPLWKQCPLWNLLQQ